MIAYTGNANLPIGAPIPIPGPTAVPHQLFSSSAVINPMIRGMFGFDGDAARKTLVVMPHIPQEWNVEFDRYRVGDPLEVILALAFASGAVLVGTPSATGQLDSSPDDAHVTLKTSAAVSAVQTLIKDREAAPVLVKPSPGAPAPH